jgi:hypothetical protein
LSKSRSPQIFHATQSSQIEQIIRDVAVEKRFEPEHPAYSSRFSTRNMVGNDLIAGQVVAILLRGHAEVSTFACAKELGFSRKSEAGGV